MARYGKCKICKEINYTSIARDITGKKIGHVCTNCWMGLVRERASSNVSGIREFLP